MNQFAIYPSLKDRVVFINGGGSGIWAGIVEHFCAQKSKAALVDIAGDASQKLAAGIARAGHPRPRSSIATISRRTLAHAGSRNGGKTNR